MATIRRTACLLSCSLGLVLLWWLVRRRLVGPPTAPYQMALGWNIVRNAGCLALFSFNLPREAIRLFVDKHSVAGLLWGAGCVAAQLAGCRWLLAGRLPGSTRKDAGALLAFFAIGLAPHLFLAWNCYAYYASIAVVAYAILAGWAVHRARPPRAAIALLVLSAAASAWGNYFVDYPALVARARWADRQLDIIQSLSIDERAAVFVKVEDDHKFQAFGIAGMAYRLRLPADRFVILPPDFRPPLPRPTIVVPRQGDVYIAGKDP